MPDEYDIKKRLSKEINRQKKLEEERVKAAKGIVKNLKEQKKIEEEHLAIVNQHQKYWEKELEKTKDRERYDDLKNKLELEGEIRDKISAIIKHLDKEIKFQEEHARKIS